MSSFFQDNIEKLLPDDVLYLDTNDGSMSKFLSTVAISLDSVKDLIDNFCEIFDVDNCPAAYLPILSKMLGYPLYEHDSEARQRQQVKAAAEIFRLKGMESALQILLYGLGLHAEVVELWTYDYETFDESPGTTIYDVENFGATYGRWIEGSLGYQDADSTLPIEPLWYKSPHFGVRLSFVDTSEIAQVQEMLTYIRERIELVRPAHTVLDFVEFTLELSDTYTDEITDSIEPSVWWYDRVPWPCRVRYKGAGLQYYRDGTVPSRDEFTNTFTYQHFRYLLTIGDTTYDYRGDFDYEFSFYTSDGAYAWRDRSAWTSDLRDQWAWQAGIKPSSDGGKQAVFSLSPASASDGTFIVGADGLHVWARLVATDGSICELTTNSEPLSTSEFAQVTWYYQGSTSTFGVLVGGSDLTTDLSVVGSIPSILKSYDGKLVLGGTASDYCMFAGNIYMPRYSTVTEEVLDDENSAAWWPMTWQNFEDSGVGDLDLAGVSVDPTIRFGNFHYYSGEPLRICDYGDTLIVDATAAVSDTKGSAYGRRDGVITRRDFEFDGDSGQTRFYLSRGGDADYIDGLQVYVTDYATSSSWEIDITSPYTHS